MDGPTVACLGEAGHMVRARRPVRLYWFSLSLAIALAVLGIYKLQPDSLTFVTVFPVWCWWIPGLLCGAIGWRSVPWTIRRALIAVWLIVVWCTSDTPEALLRRPPSAESDPARNKSRATLRVVSFNTGSVPPGILDELERWHPDIVLLQETYSRDAVARLTESLFGDAGGYVWNSENSILARGSVTADLTDNPELQTFALAEVRIVDGPMLRVANLRLDPQPVRFDFWAPDCWLTYAGLRRRHRQQLTVLLVHCDRHPSDAPVLIGGDFNAPAGDAIFRLLRPKYADVFHEAGRGWGCMLPNDLPLLRIDQIWASYSLEPIAVWALASQRSDHRMVIADLRVTR